MNNSDFMDRNSGDNDSFDLDAAESKVRSAADLPEFLRLLNKHVILADPEFRDRFLSDAFEGAAAWIEDGEQPDQPDWQYLARLLVGAIYYN